MMNKGISKLMTENRVDSQLFMSHMFTKMVAMNVAKKNIFFII
jgi:hypothetical protein